MDWIIPKKIYLCPWNRGCLPDYVLQSTPVSNKTRNLDKSQPFSVIISIIESTKIRKIHSSVKRRGFPDKRGVRSPGQMRTVVFQTDTDRGLTDKRGLRFTDRRSLDFPDTCHLDFPDTRQLNFPDASYLTKRPKSGTTELPSQMARGGLTALGTRGRGPRSGRAWSAQSHSETGRGEPTTATPGRLFC